MGQFFHDIFSAIATWCVNTFGPIVTEFTNAFHGALPSLLLMLLVAFGLYIAYCFLTEDGDL